MALNSKIVLLNIMDRNIRLFLTPHEEASDLAILRFAFQQAIRGLRNDDPLKVKVGRNEVIFQMFDKMFDAYVDLYDSDAIPDKARLKAFIVVRELDDMDGHVSTPQQPQQTPPLNGAAAIQEHPVEMEPENEVGGEFPPAISPGHLDTVPSTSPESVPSPTVAVNSVPYPAPLTAFSQKLNNAIVNGNLLRHYLLFVRECAHALTGIVTRPSRMDYANFCRTIGSHYPVVKDADGTMESFKRQLTRVIRNARFKASRKCQAPEAASQTLQQAAKRQRVSEILETIATTSATASSEESDHAKELRKFLKSKPLASLGKREKEHVSLLHKATFQGRRTMVEKMTAERLTYENIYMDVCAEYPEMMSCYWVIQELELVTETARKETRKANFEALIDALERHGGTKKSETEAEKLDTLHRIYTRLSSDKKERVIPPIKKLKVGDVIDLTCDKLQTPFLKVYLTEEGEIAAAYCIAGNGYYCKLEAEGDRLDASMVADLLLATYFAFHIGFPPKYFGFLLLLQEKILNIPNREAKKPPIKLTSLLRELKE